MEKKLRENLFELASVFAKHGVTERQIGWRAVQNLAFFQGLRSDKGFTVRSYDRIVAWCAANWPADVGWPKGIARPSAVQKETA